MDGIDVLIVNGAQWEAGRVLDNIDATIASLIDVNALGMNKHLSSIVYATPRVLSVIVSIVM